MVYWYREPLLSVKQMIFELSVGFVGRSDSVIVEILQQVLSVREINFVKASHLVGRPLRWVFSPLCEYLQSLLHR